MNDNPKFLAMICLSILALLLAACNAPSAPTPDSKAILTQAAGTAAARLTEAAQALPPPTATQPPSPTDPPAPAAPTNEPPTNTPVAAIDTQAPTATPTSPPAGSTSGDAASYVADVDYPDNTPIGAGEKLTKTWRIKNTGTTTWTTGYSLVCIDPGKFQCPEAVALSGEVKSGESVDIKVQLTAPTQAGTQKAFFRMRNAAGQFFKFDGTGDLWIQLVVGAAAGTSTVTATPGGSTATPTLEVTPTATLTPTP